MLGADTRPGCRGAACARALRTRLRHPGLVSPHPDVACRALTRGDRFAILATDGLWDVVSDQEAVTCVNKVLGDGTPSVALCEEAAAACVAKARKERTMDNVLVLVLCFLWNDAA